MTQDGPLMIWVLAEIVNSILSIVAISRREDFNIVLSQEVSNGVYISVFGC